MYIPKTFFVLTLITYTCSLHTMSFDKLPKNIIVQLIGNMRTHTSDKDNSIRVMSRDMKALSLTDKPWYINLNGFSFTNMLIKSLACQLCFNELRVANNIITLGGNICRLRYLEDMGFH